MNFLNRFSRGSTTVTVSAPFVKIAQEIKPVDYQPRAVPELPVTNWDTFQYTTVLIVETDYNKVMLTNVSNILVFLIQSSEVQNYLQLTDDDYVTKEVVEGRGTVLLRNAVENRTRPGSITKPDGTSVQVVNINMFQQLYNYWARFSPEVSFPCKPNEEVTLWHYSRSPPSIPNKSFTRIKLDGRPHGWTRSLSGRTWAFDMTTPGHPDRIPGMVYNALRTTSHILIITDQQSGYRPEGEFVYVKIGRKKLKRTRIEEGTWILVKVRGGWSDGDYTRFSARQPPIEMLIA